MPTCKWVDPKLVGFVVGELSERQALAVAAHVRRCPSCRRALCALQDTVTAVARSASDPPQLPPLAEGEVARLRESVRNGGVRPRRPAWAVATAAVVLGLFAFAGVRLVGAHAIAKVVKVSGHPQVRLGDRGWQPLALQASLPAGGSLRTGDTDQLEVELTDGSRVRVDFGTEVRIATRRDRPWSAERADLYLRRGRLSLLVTAAQSGLRVHTAAGVAEALGTLFEVSAASRPTGGKGPSPEADVAVLRGEVRVSNAQGSVLAVANTMTQAREGQAPSIPHGTTYLCTVRSRLPWQGRTKYEVWLIPPLDLGEAARRLAGPRGWLGLELASASVTLAGAPLPGPGLTISRVAPRSPAAQAGLVAGDRLVRVGEVALGSRGDLWRTEVLYLPGSKVEVEFRRGQETRHASLTCAEHPLASPASVEPRLVEANRALVSGRTGDARRGYEPLAQAGLAAALHNLGLIEEMAGDLYPSLDHYAQAVARDGREPRYHYSKAVAFARLGNRPMAIGEFQAALARAPHYPEARLLLGRMLGLNGEFAVAQEQAAALRADPATRLQGLCLAGELERIQDDPRAALPRYQQAAAIAPLDPEAPTSLGAAYYLLGDLPQAESWTLRALTLDPGSVRALNRLGQIRADQNRLKEAESLFLRASAAQPGYAVVLSNLGRTYYKMGRLAEAKRWYQRAVEADRDGAVYHLGLAMTLEREHDFAAAEREYRVVLALEPAYEEGYLRLASFYDGQGRGRSARQVEQTARSYGLRLTKLPTS